MTASANFEVKKFTYVTLLDVLEMLDGYSLSMVRVLPGVNICFI